MASHSHQLSNGLMVSGPPENQSKERVPTMSSRAVPYTGGDIKKSGELGKMLMTHHSTSSKIGPPPTLINNHSTSSGSNKKYSSSSSGPIIAPTGLITSEPQRRSGGPVSGPPDVLRSSGKPNYGQAVSNLVNSKNVFVLLAVFALFLPVVLLLLWNYAWRNTWLLAYVRKYPDKEFRGAVDGQFIKITGVVTCGSISLESSYQREPRCVYVSTELSEYKGLRGKSANPKHRCFSWGLRYSERYVADFYISDMESGLRAHVKAGHGNNVAPFVEPSTVVDRTKNNGELSPDFLRWLADRSLSSDDRIMRLKEGYIKEGETVSVMGIVKRHENIVTIVPPSDPVSTGCQWLRCLLPTYVESLILTCDTEVLENVVVVWNSLSGSPNLPASRRSLLINCSGIKIVDRPREVPQDPQYGFNDLLLFICIRLDLFSLAAGVSVKRLIPR
ncbi:hypothetical protein ACFE04_029613 [Oxalis oulophora]